MVRTICTLITVSGLMALSAEAGAQAPKLAPVKVTMLGTRLLFKTALVDPFNHVTSLHLNFRAADTPFQSVAMQINAGEAGVLVEAADLLQGSESLRVFYYVVGTGRRAVELVHVGSEAEPMSVFVTQVFDAKQLDEPPANVPTASVSDAEQAIADVPVTPSVPPPPPMSPVKGAVAPAASSPNTPAWVRWTLVSAMVVAGGALAGYLFMAD